MLIRLAGQDWSIKMTYEKERKKTESREKAMYIKHCVWHLKSVWVPKTQKYKESCK